MTRCPTCNNEVDPLRAPSARVIGGRVVAFCSAACANAASAAGAAAAKARIAEAAAPPPAAAKPAAAVKVATPVAAEPARARPRATTPVGTDDVVEENVAAPKRARTEPPRPPPAGSGTRAATGAEVDDDDVPSLRPRRRRGLVLMFAAIIIVGGMAIAIVQAVSPSSPERAGATPDSPHAIDAAGLDAATAPVEVDHATAAKAALTELIHTDSDRVRRVAAAALARTGDADAIAVLAELLATEPSDITKLEIAYALGRAHDERGIAALVAATKSQRRDVKADAGRDLVLLGDPGGAGAKALMTFIDLRTMRLGAAEPLARLGDAKAIAVLEAVHADQSAPADDRTRAAIALVRAKKKELVPEVKALLADGRFNAFAATALAELGDPSGRDVLIAQLGVPSLRVDAAVALRRLDPKLDPAPILKVLVDALGENKDVARVAAAEAILVLTGDPAWSEHD